MYRAWSWANGDRSITGAGRNEVAGLEIGEKQPERGGVATTASDGAASTTEVVPVTST